MGGREGRETWKDCKLNVYASAQHERASESPEDRLKSGRASQDGARLNGVLHGT